MLRRMPRRLRRLRFIESQTIITKVLNQKKQTRKGKTARLERKRKDRTTRGTDGQTEGRSGRRTDRRTDAVADGRTELRTNW